MERPYDSGVRHRLTRRRNQQPCHARALPSDQLLDLLDLERRRSLGTAP